MLPHLKGFNLLIAEHNQPLYRDGLIDALSLEGASKTVIDADQFTEYRDLEKSLLESTSDLGLTHIINLENFSAEEQGLAFRGFNYHREQIARQCQSTIVIWLVSPLVKKMALEAADLWAWREHVFDFLVPIDIPNRWEANLNTVYGVELEKKQQRIFDLEKYLTDQGTKISLTNADMMHELGNLYESIWKLDKSLHYLNEAIINFNALDEKHAWARVMMDKSRIIAVKKGPKDALNLLESEILPCFKQLNDLDAQARAIDLIADQYTSLGQLDKALDVRRNDIEKILRKTGNTQGIAITKGKIADILQMRGELGEALRIRQKEELPIFERLGDAREVAFTKGKVADILQARGELGEALRLRQEEVLPAYERLGAVREIAMTKGKVADILQARGELSEALRIRQEEELPIFERLGDAREVAFTKGRIADVLEIRGELDKALSIRKEEELPIYERLGEVREIAIIKGKIADILQTRGELDEALRIRIEEQLPVLENLEDIRATSITKVRITAILWQMDKSKYLEKITELLEEALTSFKAMQLPNEIAYVESTFKRYGLK